MQKKKPVCVPSVENQTSKAHKIEGAIWCNHSNEQEREEGLGTSLCQKAVLWSKDRHWCRDRLSFLKKVQKKDGVPPMYEGLAIIESKHVVGHPEIVAFLHQMEHLRKTVRCIVISL